MRAASLRPTRPNQPITSSRMEPRRSPWWSATTSPDLPADLHRRVQRRHGLLEDHRHLVAPEFPHGAFRQAHQLAAAQLDAARDGGVLGQQAENGQRGDGLARPRLADDPKPLSLTDAEGDALDRRRAVAERDGEIGHLEVAHRISLSLGSRRSRRPSPRRLNPMVAIAIARPGQSASIGALKR